MPAGIPPEMVVFLSCATLVSLAFLHTSTFLSAGQILKASLPICKIPSLFTTEVKYGSSIIGAASLPFQYFRKDWKLNDASTLSRFCPCRFTTCVSNSVGFEKTSRPFVTVSPARSPAILLSGWLIRSSIELLWGINKFVDTYRCSCFQLNTKTLGVRFHARQQKNAKKYVFHLI